MPPSGSQPWCSFGARWCPSLGACLVPAGLYEPPWLSWCPLAARWYLGLCACLVPAGRSESSWLSWRPPSAHWCPRLRTHVLPAGRSEPPWLSCCPLVPAPSVVAQSIRGQAGAHLVPAGWCASLRWSLRTSVAEPVPAWCPLKPEPWCPRGAHWSLRASVAELVCAWCTLVPEP